MFNKKVQFIVILLLIFTFLAGCTGIIRGNGTISTEGREVSGFTEIQLRTSAKVQLTQADSFSLMIEAEENLLAHIETVVEGDTLVIQEKSNSIIQSTKPIIIRLSMPTINAIAISGSGSVNAGVIEGNNFDLAVTGSGNLLIEELDAAGLDAVISGSGNITLAGQSESQSVVVSGSGDYNSNDLQSETAVVSVTGSGNAELWATNTLNATVTGSGNIDYYGDPVVERNISGSGDINAQSGR